MFIDADAHVDENDETWSYVPKSKESFRPLEMTFVEGAGYFGRATQRRTLFIDGHIFTRHQRRDDLTMTTVEQRELYDVPARIKHMDELGLDVQVIYPTVLLNEVTRRPEVETAVCEAYNRWIADRTSDTNGRLRWNATLPYRSIPDALKEMKRTKKEGAIGIIKRPFECDDRRAADPYFFPIYELAQELDMPICMHIGAPYNSYSGANTTTEKGATRMLYIQDAFLSLLMFAVYKKFPRLRFGFIEASAGWVPFNLYLAQLTSVAHVNRDQPGESLVPQTDYASVLDESNLYITCEPGEDLETLIHQIGDDHILVGTDYSHQDRSSLLESHRLIMNQAGNQITKESATKITDTNGRIFYGLTDL